jgi:hypothetical protein
VNELAALFFSRDPGATNQLVAVYELLCSRPSTGVPAIQELRKCIGEFSDTAPKAVIIGKKYALDIWRTAGVQAENWDDVCQPMAQMLEDRNIALVITGTDDIDEPDTVRLWQTAQQAGIPVAVFLDNLINLEERFRIRGGNLIAPDLVFALDQHSAESLITAGIPKSRLRITENLHLERLARMANDNADARDKLRVTWGTDSITQVILFASENTAEMAALGRQAPYDENAILLSLIDELARGRSVGEVDPARGPVLVVIRPHPRDTAGKYVSYARIKQPRVKVSNAGTSLQAILAADLVAGMESALLFEAHAVGRPALSLVAESTFNKILATPH